MRTTILALCGLLLCSGCSAVWMSEEYSQKVDFAAAKFASDARVADNLTRPEMNEAIGWSANEFHGIDQARKGWFTVWMSADYLRRLQIDVALGDELSKRATNGKLTDAQCRSIITELARKWRLWQDALAGKHEGEK